MFLSLNLRRLGEMNPVRVAVEKSSNIVMEETNKLRSSVWELWFQMDWKIVVDLSLVLRTGRVETMGSILR
jgi:hypothetical protein